MTSKQCNMWGEDKDHAPSLRGVTSHILRPKTETARSCVVNFKAFLVKSIKTVMMILFYYTFSIGLTFYNKWLFKDFHYPLLTSSTHFLITFVLCGFARVIVTKCRKETPSLAWSIYVRRVFITGIVSALDIGLSNWSFEFITVSLYTMVKSSAVLFILGFALILKLEKARWSLVAVVTLIASGLFLSVYQSTQFNLEGFILVLVASFIGGLRWTFSQILTQKQELGLGNPIDLLWHLTPTMFLGLFPLAFGLEGLAFFSSEKLFAADVIWDRFPIMLKIFSGGILAFFLGFSEYLLLSNTSSLTLSICGIFKELCTLFLAAHYNGDKMTMLNKLGFAICISGIALHVFLKNRAMAEEKAAAESFRMRLLASEDLISEEDSSSEDELFNIMKR